MEYLELCQEWFCASSGWYICHESDYFFLYSYEWLYVRFLVVTGSPDCYAADEVWVDVLIILLLKSLFAYLNVRMVGCSFLLCL